MPAGNAPLTREQLLEAGFTPHPIEQGLFIAPAEATCALCIRRNVTCVVKLPDKSQSGPKASRLACTVCAHAHKSCTQATLIRHQRAKEGREGPLDKDEWDKIRRDEEKRARALADHRRESGNLTPAAVRKTPKKAAGTPVVGDDGPVVGDGQTPSKPAKKPRKSKAALDLGEPSATPATKRKADDGETPAKKRAPRKSKAAEVSEDADPSVRKTKPLPKKARSKAPESIPLPPSDDESAPIAAVKRVKELLCDEIPNGYDYYAPSTSTPVRLFRAAAGYASAALSAVASPFTYFFSPSVAGKRKRDGEESDVEEERDEIDDEAPKSKRMRAGPAVEPVKTKRTPKPTAKAVEAAEAAATTPKRATPAATPATLPKARKPRQSAAAKAAAGMAVTPRRKAVKAVGNVANAAGEVANAVADSLAPARKTRSSVTPGPHGAKV